MKKNTNPYSERMSVNLTPDQMRSLVRGISALYRQVRTSSTGEPSGSPAAIPSTNRENNDE